MCLLFVAAAALVASPGEVLPAHAGPSPRVAVAGAAQSVGSPNEGHLVGGVKLESKPYLRVLPGREERWGLPELVGLLDRSARRVDRRFPGSTLGVGDLSRRGGGDVMGHQSHESGRDADVAFYLRDARGKQVAAPHMSPIDDTGRATAVSGAAFDDARNWALLEAWLTDPSTRINRVFVAEHLRDRLLAHARRAGVSAALRARASEVLLQPKTAAHDDHFHVRIGCPRNQEGCLEFVTREEPKRAVTQRGRAPKPRRRAGSAHVERPAAAVVASAVDDFGAEPLAAVTPCATAPRRTARRSAAPPAACGCARWRCALPRSARRSRARPARARPLARRARARSRRRSRGARG